MHELPSRIVNVAALFYLIHGSFFVFTFSRHSQIVEKHRFYL